MHQLKQVTIIQRVLPHYRIPFFRLTSERLKTEGISLGLIYGQEFPDTVPKTVSIVDKWAHMINNRYIKLLSFELVWQPCLRSLVESDLIIFEQANRLLINYLLIFNRTKYKRIAYWGHGKNMQTGGRKTFPERLKKILSSQVSWWFAYTDLSARIIADAGFPKEKISVVQNSIDTTKLSEEISSISESDVKNLKAKMNITSENICVYCGGMYDNKKLDFLIDSCIKIRKFVPDFTMIFIGDGPEQYKVEKAAGQNNWLYYVGPKYGLDRVPFFLMSKALLMPGMVGLAIIDSFVAGLPIFTTNIPIHSPEIDYLKNGVNGVATPFSSESYVDAVVNFLKSRKIQNKLKSGCSVAAEKYTINHMVDNFIAGIKDCLAL